MDEQAMQQIQQLVVAAMQGNQEAIQMIQQIQQKAQQGDQQSAQLIQIIQQVAQQIQGQQVQAARFGAKLNYIKSLRGQCPEGFQLEYYKKGGQLCKRCASKKKMQEGGQAEPENPVEAYKAACGKKLKANKKVKMQKGDKITSRKKPVKLSEYPDDKTLKKMWDYENKGDYASSDSIAFNEGGNQDFILYPEAYPGKVQSNGLWSPNRAAYQKKYGGKNIK